MPDNLPITEFTREELGDLIGFEVDEIKENRAGKISSRQLNRMRLFGLIFLILVPVFAYQAYNNYSIATAAWCIDTCRLFAVFRLAISTFGIVAVLALSTRLVVWIPKVATKAGVLSVKGGLLSGIRWFPIRIKDKKLSMGWTTKRLRLGKGHYETYVQAYYLDTFVPFYPILSAEPIDEGAYNEENED